MAKPKKRTALQAALAKSEREKLERAFLYGLVAYGRDLPSPQREHVFAAETYGRAWRFDFAWPGHGIAVEIHGGAWLGAKGGHTSGHGLQRDAEKTTAATMLGWRLLTFTARDVTARNLPATIETVRRAINQQAKREV